MLAWLALLSPAFPTRAPTAPKWPNATKCRASIASNLCTHIVCDELGADRNCSDPLVCYRCAMLNFAAFTSTKKEPVAVECPCIGPNRAANRGCAATNQLNAAEAMANACGLPSPTEEASTVVSLPDGRKLKGFVPRGYPSAQHRTFRGIPYAAPPVGDLRWRPPQAYPAWHGVRDAKEFGATCAQLGPGWTSILGVKSSSEDCLFLNVYAPLPSSSIGGSAFGMYPTMLYMPAGQLTWGSSADLENLVAPQIPVAADVIFITANYRVGPAGFLAMEAMRSRSPTGSVGNYGTLDQRAVLQWIRDNIVAFGGDPSNVVLWGESAGASIVSDHIVLKRSQPLFSKAIIESGAFNPWAYKTLRTAEANARHLAQNLNCSGPNATSGVPHPSDAALVKCLLNASIEDLNFWSDDVMGAASAFPYTLPYSNRMDKCLWGPTIDGVELTDRPDLLLARGAASPKLAVLMGTNRDEGSTFTFAQHGFGDNATTNQSAYRDWVNHAKAPKPPVVVPWEKKTPGNCSVYLNASRNPHVRTCVLAHAHDGHPKYNPANITIGNTSACFHCIQNLSEVKMHCGDIRHKKNRTFRAMNKNASLIAQFVCRAAYPSPHYTPGGGSIEVTNATDFNSWATNIWGTNVARVATEMYKPNSTVQGITSWWWAVTHAIGDFVLTCPNRHAARLLAAKNTSAWAYYFNHTPQSSVNDRDTAAIGAFHGAEVPFVWNDLFELAPGGERNLSRSMVTYWTNFAWSGDPNTRGEVSTLSVAQNLPKWPRFTNYTKDGVGTFLVFGDPADDAPRSTVPNISTVTGLKTRLCDVWDAVYAYGN